MKGRTGIEWWSKWFRNQTEMIGQENPNFFETFGSLLHSTTRLALIGRI